MATKRDVIERAFRRIGVVGENRPPNAAQFATGEALLEAIWAETRKEAPIVWTIEDVPAEALLPLSMVLSYDLAGEYGVPPRESRGAGMIRLLGVVRPDNRPYTEATFY